MGTGQSSGDCRQGQSYRHPEDMDSRQQGREGRKELFVAGKLKRLSMEVASRNGQPRAMLGTDCKKNPETDWAVLAALGRGMNQMAC